MLVEDRNDILFEISGYMLEELIDFTPQEMTVSDLANMLKDCLFEDTGEKIEIKEARGFFLPTGSKKEQLEHFRNTILYLAAIVFQMGGFDDHKRDQ